MIIKYPFKYVNTNISREVHLQEITSTDVNPTSGYLHYTLSGYLWKRISTAPTHLSWSLNVKSIFRCLEVSGGEIRDSTLLNVPLSYVTSRKSPIKDPKIQIECPVRSGCHHDVNTSTKKRRDPLRDDQINQVVTSLTFTVRGNTLVVSVDAERVQYLDVSLLDRERLNCLNSVQRPTKETG